jgi:hypothetical protein
VKRAALVCAALALLAAVYATRAARKMPDLEVYWKAGIRAAAAEPLYRAEDGHYQLKYLPAFAVLAVPLGWLPLDAAKAAWFTVSAALLGAFVALSLAALPERRRARWVLAAAVVVAMAKFYGHELVLGQVNLLLGAVAMAAVLALQRGNDGVSGALFALAVVVKPYAALFLPWLAAIHRVRALGAAVAGVIAALLLPVPFYGLSGTWALHADWWRTVTVSTAPNLLNADNVSLAAFYARWLGPEGTAAALAAVTGAALLGVAAHVVRMHGRVREPLGLEAALLLTLVPLLSPQGWDYVFLLATPAVAYLVNYADRLPVGWKVAAAVAVGVAAFSLFDIMGRRAYAAFMSWSIITLCYVVVIGSLWAMRRTRVA